MKLLFAVALLSITSAGVCGEAANNAKPEEDFSWMHGANYVPSYARNDVAIWMDYDPAVIDHELEYAQKLRLNTVRVFLNQAVYELRPSGSWSVGRASSRSARSTDFWPCPSCSIPASIHK